MLLMKRESTTAATARKAASTPTQARTARRRPRRRMSSLPSFLMSTTMTVTLSWPPAMRAADTRASAQTWGLAEVTQMSSISASVTMDERPSEHRITRSPASTPMVKWSAYMSGSEPRARVMTEREGCTRASSAVISPASTSSSTKEWSWVTRTRAPLCSR